MLFFCFIYFLVARAKNCSKFRWFFGVWEKLVFCFWDLLTFKYTWLDFTGVLTCKHDTWLAIFCTEISIIQVFEAFQSATFYQITMGKRFFRNINSTLFTSYNNVNCISNQLSFSRILFFFNLVLNLTSIAEKKKV